MERARKDGLPKKLDRACCVPITLFGLGSQLRIKETTKQVQHEATSCIGSYRTNTNREVPKGNDDHVTNGNGVRTVVFPTSVSLVEPDAKGFDLHTPGLVSDATQVPMQVQAYSGQEIYRQMISKNTSPNSDTSIGTDSVTETDSPQHTGHVFVVALEDANVGMEIDHQSVASSAPGETAEEMEARVRREVETQIRQEMEAEKVAAAEQKKIAAAEEKMRTPEHRKEEEEAAAEAAGKEVAAREDAEARKAQEVVQEAAELASREAAAAAAAAQDAAAQRARDAAEAVAREASEARVREAEAAVAAAEAEAQRAVEEAERRKAAALAEKADGLLKAGHAANKQGDYAKARRAFQEAHALQHKPAALVSAANMALKLGEASTAKREYEQALTSSGLTENVIQATEAKLLEATSLMEKQVRDAVNLEHQLAAQKINAREKLRHMDSLAAADVDTIELAALIGTAEASGVEPGEVSKARILLARAKAAQEVKRHRAEVAALESLRLATAPGSVGGVSEISRAQLEAALAACRACNAPAPEVEAGQARLVQVIKWQKLGAALAPNADGGWDLVSLREAIEEASAAGLPPMPEAQATLLRAEEAAKERVVRQKMRREAEKNLSAAMPSMFGMNKTDAAKLGKAVDIARKAGVDDKLIAAAELKLLPMRAEAEAKAKAEAERLAYEERMRPILEAARREAEERTKADAEARMVASAYEAARREAEDRARIAGQAEATAAMTEAEALRCQEAANELRLAAGMSLGMLDLPRLMRAVDAADEAGVDLEQIRAAQKTLATAQRRAAAKEGLVAALEPSVEELTSSDAALFRLREAATEAEAVGLPSLAAARQKLAAAEKVLAQKEELGRREAGRREEQEKLRREAEAELKAAMPGLLTSAEPHRLQAAVDAAKVAGVSPVEIRAAEAKLSALWTKEAISGEKARLAAEAAQEAKLAHYEKELKAAAGLGGWGFGSQEVTDVLRLEAAIEAARGAGITSEVLGKAEAKLAAIRIDAEKKRSFELTNPDAAAQELRKSFEKQNASRNASFESSQKQSFERDGLPPLPSSARAVPALPEADSFQKGPPPAPPKRTAAPSMASRSTGSFSKAFSSVSKGVMGIGSKPLPFAPNAPGMAEKLEGQRGGGFSAVRGSGPGGGGGAQASAGPKKIKASSAPLKFAPGAPTAGGKGPVRMQRRTSTDTSDN